MAGKKKLSPQNTAASSTNAIDTTSDSEELRTKEYVAFLEANRLRPVEDAGSATLQKGQETIGKEGGIIRSGRHRLLVQRDSVLEPTQFEMKANAAIVSLKSDLTENRFNRPVVLVMTAGNSGKGSIYEVQLDPPLLLPLGVYDSTSKEGYAAIDHFSTYVLAAPF